MGNGNKAEMLIAICAVLTSVIALFVAWDQGRVMRAQQHGSVYPVLQVDGFVSQNSDEAQMGLRFSNSGVGPALIESITVMRGDEELDGLIEPFRALPGSPQFNWSGMTGRAIAPGESIKPLEVFWPIDAVTPAQLSQVADEWGELSLNICYCSVFDRCWLMKDIGTSRAERVDRCERSDRDIFAELASAYATPEIDTTPEVE